MEEVDHAEHKAIGILAHLIGAIADFPPVALHPLEGSGSAGEPVPGPDNAPLDGIRDRREVALVRIGNARATGYPQLGHAGSRHDGDVVELVVLAAIGSIFLGEKDLQRLDHLIGPLASFADMAAYRFKLLVVPAWTHAELEPPLAEQLQATDLLCQEGWLTDRHYEDASPERYILG